MPGPVEAHLQELRRPRLSTHGKRNSTSFNVSRRSAEVSVADVNYEAEKLQLPLRVDSFFPEI